MRRRRKRSSRWSDYVPVAERRYDAARLAWELEHEGRELAPVRVVARGNKIAQSFWGRSWCENLERFSDFENRLPRGRTYVRNGSVIDLQITAGRVSALVSGSEIYQVEVAVKPLPKARWQKLCADCADDIDSLVELLQGRFSDGVMEVLCRPRTGLFPEPTQLAMSCSCPDWAMMCKHVAAVLYGVGARLDSEPELLFALRQVDHTELVSARDGGLAAATAGAAAEDLIGEDLGAIFGIELAAPERGLHGRPGAARTPEARKQAQPRAAAAKLKAAAKPTPTAKPRSTSKLKAAVKRVPSGVRRPAAAPDQWVTAAELRQRGVPYHVVQAWLHKGEMTHSGERGIYVRTESVEALVDQFLRSARATKKR